MESTSNARPDISMGLGFHGWHYFMISIQFSPLATPEQVCLDSGCSITLADASWIQEQLPRTQLQTMATPLRVHGLGAVTHTSTAYILLPMYFQGTCCSDKKKVLATFTQEVHLVDNLQAKMLISIDILGPEKIDLLLSQGVAHIGSCNIDAEITAHPKGPPIHAPVHTGAHMMILAHSCIAVPVKHWLELLGNNLTDAQDLLFKPATSGISIFAHLANATMSAVLVHNDTSRPIHLPQGYQLSFLEDFNLSYEAFHILNADPGLAELTLQNPQVVDECPPTITPHG